MSTTLTLQNLNASLKPNIIVFYTAPPNMSSILAPAADALTSIVMFFTALFETVVAKVNLSVGNTWYFKSFVAWVTWGLAVVSSPYVYAASVISYVSSLFIEAYACVVILICLVYICLIRLYMRLFKARLQ